MESRGNANAKPNPNPSQSLRPDPNPDPTPSSGVETGLGHEQDSDGDTLVILTDEPLDSREVEARVARDSAGAICTFQGVVRDHHLGRAVHYLSYEAFPAMALPAMQAIVEEIHARWPETRACIAHRFGRLEIGEASVIISVSSPHRAESFEACRHAIDTLKNTVPIWKKEIYAGGEAWVEGVPTAPLDTNPFVED